MITEIYDWVERTQIDDPEKVDALLHYILEVRKQVAIFWSVEDVQQLAKDDYNTYISDLEAWEILQEVHCNADAVHGITWDTIDAYVSDWINPLEADDE